MRDDEIRELERDKDDSPGARAAWLHALIDAGRLEPGHVDALAYAGDEGARTLVALKEPSPLAWLVGLWDYGQRPTAVAIIAMVADALEQRGAKVAGQLSDLLRMLLEKAEVDELSVDVFKEACVAGNALVFQFATLKVHEVDLSRMLEKGKAAVAAWALSGGDMGPVLALLPDRAEADAPSAPSGERITVQGYDTSAAAFALLARRVIESVDAGASPEAFAEGLRSSLPWVAEWIAALQPDVLMHALREASAAEGAPEDVRQFASGLVSRLESHPDWLARAVSAMTAGGAA